MYIVWKCSGLTTCTPTSATPSQQLIPHHGAPYADTYDILRHMLHKYVNVSDPDQHALRLADKNAVRWWRHFIYAERVYEPLGTPHTYNVVTLSPSKTPAGSAVNGFCRRCLALMYSVKHWKFDMMPLVGVFSGFTRLHHTFG